MPGAKAAVAGVGLGQSDVDLVPRVRQDIPDDEQPDADRGVVQERTSPGHRSADSPGSATDQDRGAGDGTEQPALEQAHLRLMGRLEIML
jgi:hypothetical protein